jgi:hypothetical protein
VVDLAILDGVVVYRSDLGLHALRTTHQTPGMIHQPARPSGSTHCQGRLDSAAGRSTRSSDSPRRSGDSRTADDLPGRLLGMCQWLSSITWGPSLSTS